jgi:colicin import membrane protein
MWQLVRENPRAVIYAVLMHAGLLLLLVFSLDWTPKSVKPGTTKPIQAELVDMSKLREIEAQKQAEQQRLAAEKRKLEQEKQRQAEAERKQKAEAEKQRKADVERKQKAEQEAKRKAEAEKQRQAEARRKAEQETKRKAEAERKQQAEQAAKQKAEAEKQRQAKQEAERKAEVERKRKAEEEAKRKAAAAARQREAEKALQAKLAEEAAQARAQSALSEFIPYIQQKVQNNWLRPAGSPPGLSCVIQVTLIPGGEVAGTRVVRSSGNALFDESVERAVQKASPLPLPADVALFKYFREINFKFVPD